MPLTNTTSMALKVELWNDTTPKVKTFANAQLCGNEWRLWWKRGNKIVKRIVVPPQTYYGDEQDDCRDMEGKPEFPHVVLQMLVLNLPE